ncbi:hypothetical protein [Mesorhizobium sp. M1B.F.Ca.ET.045.04.1.1]|uniref:hypothetical protein n=1 Tax=Mesorhizobium sp. M1B.F.Ca.ET.045.04.1.1 TaxID=2493673 RepID=UPI0016795297|nr:hypothetical protein [Mesorhizobium sp. M1B.F.Ca.ET.045.04.1.1]
MERIFDELIGLQMKRPARRWRATATELALRITSSLATDLAIGVGIAFGLVLAGKPLKNSPRGPYFYRSSALQCGNEQKG